MMNNVNFYIMLYDLIKEYNKQAGEYNLKLSNKSVRLIQQTLEQRFANNEVDDTIQMNEIFLYSFNNKINIIVDDYLDIPIDEIIGENNQDICKKIYDDILNRL